MHKASIPIATVRLGKTIFSGILSASAAREDQLVQKLAKVQLAKVTFQRKRLRQRLPRARSPAVQTRTRTRTRSLC